MEISLEGPIECYELRECVQGVTEISLTANTYCSGMKIHIALTAYNPLI